MAEATDSPLAGARAPARMLAHFWMILGVIVVAFPVYYVAIASTHSTVTILRPPLPLLPGSEAVANYHDAFTGGISQIGGVSLWRLLANSTIIAMGIALGKIDFHGLACDRVLSLSAAHGVFLVDFHHPYAAGRGADPAHL